MFSNDQQAAFNTRVARIRDPRNTHYKDLETGMNVPKRVSKLTVLNNRKVAPPSVFALMMAIALGAICLVAARFLRFSVLDMPQINDTTMAVELALAAILAFVLGGMLGQKTTRHMVAQVAGAAFMAIAMHNLVWMAPDIFGQYYSQDYVNQVQSQTVPASLFLRGETYTI
jgi:hypothetical protein